MIKKRILPALLSLFLLVGSVGCAEVPSGSDSSSSQPPRETGSQSATEESTTNPPPAETDVARAIWQDPGNVVLLWSCDEHYEYSIYRSDNPNDGFEYLGRSTIGSWRDDSVEYPNEYYYKIKGKNLKTQAVVEFEPTRATVSPDAVDSVSVIMYHNFVSEEDIANGIEFEEYSISPADFEQDLIWLRDNGYVTITSRELLYFLENREPIPQKAVILSIDDGSWGVYTNAWPLLKEYGMKADFNVIGERIDTTWDMINKGGTRKGDPAPFCTWEELIEMQESGEINICSHTYGLHVYDRDGRIGMSMMEGESSASFAQAVRADYNLAVSSIEGWTGIMTDTVAYPYSKRSPEADKIVLENTGYKILMAGEGARGTAGNYFVRGCDVSRQLMLMSRPCRMDGTPISVYLERIESQDAENGVNVSADSLQ